MATSATSFPCCALDQGASKPAAMEGWAHTEPPDVAGHGEMILERDEAARASVRHRRKRVAIGDSADVAVVRPGPSEPHRQLIGDLGAQARSDGGVLDRHDLNGHCTTGVAAVNAEIEGNSYSGIPPRHTAGDPAHALWRLAERRR